MEAVKKIVQDDYLITMKDIIREGHPTLRKKAEEVSIPLSPEMVKLGNRMLDFLKNSQNSEKREKLKLRSGVGLAAPQLDISKRIIAILIPDYEKGGIILEELMCNPKIISYSVQEGCLKEGEGCLSVDRKVPGFVVRRIRITVTYFNIDNEQKKLKLKDYEAMVVQHEIDHLNGIMFFDHINNKQPWHLSDGVKIIE